MKGIEAPSGSLREQARAIASGIERFCEDGGSIRSLILPSALARAVRQELAIRGKESLSQGVLSDDGKHH